MTTIWFIIVVIIGQDGTTYSDLRWPIDPQINNEIACKQNGPGVAQQYEKEYPHAVITWKCQGVAISELAKGLK